MNQYRYECPKCGRITDHVKYYNSVQCLDCFTMMDYVEEIKSKSTSSVDSMDSFKPFVLNTVNEIVNGVTDEKILMKLAHILFIFKMDHLSDIKNDIIEEINT